MHAMRRAIALTLTLCGAMGRSWAAESPTPTPSGPPTTASGEPAAALVAQGRSLFERNCAHCHGDDARGDEGPSLYDLRKSDGRIRQIILQGIPGEMPKFVSKFNDAEVAALIAYLRTLKS